MTSSRPVGPSGERRSVTVTFGYRDGPRSLVARNLPEALDGAESRWGPWLTVESVSTPASIYADVTGETVARWQPGAVRGGTPSTRSRLRAAGYEPGPGEVGGRRYDRRMGD